MVALKSLKLMFLLLSFDILECYYFSYDNASKNNELEENILIQIHKSFHLSVISRF